MEKFKWVNETKQLEIDQLFFDVNCEETCPIAGMGKDIIVSMFQKYVITGKVNNDMLLNFKKDYSKISGLDSDFYKHGILDIKSEQFWILDETQDPPAWEFKYLGKITQFSIIEDRILTN